VRSFGQILTYRVCLPTPAAEFDSESLVQVRINQKDAVMCPVERGMSYAATSSLVACHQRSASVISASVRS